MNGALGIGHWAWGMGHGVQEAEVWRGRGERLTATSPLLLCAPAPLLQSKIRPTVLG